VADRLLPTDDQRVTCIVSALKSNYHVCFRAQVVNDFTFAFITPLGAYDRYVRHRISPKFLFQQENPKEV